MNSVGALLTVVGSAGCVTSFSSLINVYNMGSLESAIILRVSLRGVAGIINFVPRLPILSDGYW
jgi:hypothetical protein